MIRSVVLLIVVLLPACAFNALVSSSRYEAGKISEIGDRYGTFFVHVPGVLPEYPRILMLIHGTPAETETAADTAHYYIDNWQDFAESQGFILIAPAFNQEDFSSRHGEITDSLTGYRGLFGREIGADEWVLRLAAAFQQEFELEAQPFFLYGHSAGGQFVGRFLVTHPDKVKRAVITSAVTYPQPKAEVAWPYGMGELHTEIRWEDGTTAPVDIVPQTQNWIDATQVPVTVMVGMGDTEPQLQRPGQEGTDRILIGRNWVDDMAVFAEANGVRSHIEFEAIPAKGHSMLGLMPFSQATLIDE